jgi:hypothetical protein
MSDVSALRRPNPQTEQGLQGLLKILVERARPTEEVSQERADNLDYYNQALLGNEVSDRSQVVTSDVFDVIETVHADMMEIFAGSDEVVNFEPTGREDEEAAKQATDYAQLVWSSDNPGFENMYDALKNALLQKTGVFKVSWEPEGESKRVEMENVSAMAVERLMTDPEIEIVGSEERTRHVENEMGLPVPETVYDLTVIHTPQEGRVRVDVVAPEHFLKSQDWNGRDRPRLVGEERPMRVSDLVEMGYDFEELDKIAGGFDTLHGLEQVARRQSMGQWHTEQDNDSDRSMRELTYRELYVRLDWDDDGVAELRQITCVGPAFHILDNSEVDDDPYVDFAAIRMPHTAIGKAYADLLRDLQKLKSTIWRQTLDNIYLINNQRAAISDKVDLQSYLDGTPGSAIMVNTQLADVSGHIAPQMPVPIGHITFPMLEYVDTVREGRLGVTRYSQGTDASSLNKTAGGISMILGRSQRRMMALARLIAETGVKPAFKKILRLIVERQDRPRTVRLRNKWVEIDPRSWNADMDVKVKVGLGHGTKEQQMFMAQTLLQIQREVVKMQGGTAGPHVTDAELHNAFTRVVEALGYREVDPYFRDPEGFQPPQAPPDPKMIVEEMRDKREREDNAMTHQREMAEIMLKDDRERKKEKLDRDIAETKTILEVGRQFATTGRGSAPQQRGARDERQDVV